MDDNNPNLNRKDNNPNRDDNNPNQSKIMAIILAILALIVLYFVFFSSKPTVTDSSTSTTSVQTPASNPSVQDNTVPNSGSNTNPR